MKIFSAALLAALAIYVVGSAAALAHPLGNFTVNRYSRIEVGQHDIRLRYVLDLAEIPTLQELRAAGIEPGKLSESERSKLLAEKSKELKTGAFLTVNGRSLAWWEHEALLELLPGQADLETMRVTLTLVSPAVVDEGTRLEYRDINYTGRVGWREVVLQAVEGMVLFGSTAPAEDVSNELRDYPADASRGPLDISSATATVSRQSVASSFSPGDTKLSTPQSRPASVRPLAPADTLAAFLRGGESGNVLGLLLALAVAVGLGAIHALEPGHGKAVMGTYLAGSRGTARHAVVMGLTMTLTHTLGVYALGLATIVAAQYILPEKVYPALGVASGLMVFAVGLSLARVRLAAAAGRAADSGPAHSDVHSHPHAWGPHGHGHAHTETRTHRGREPRDGARREAPASIGAKSLVALGVSAGLLPCPAAVVVLLAAVSLGNVALGMAMVAAFSVGLAAVLTSLGLLVVFGGTLVSQHRLLSALSRSRIPRLAPALSALAVTAAGLLMATQAAQSLV